MQPLTPILVRSRRRCMTLAKPLVTSPSWIATVSPISFDFLMSLAMLHCFDIIYLSCPHFNLSNTSSNTAGLGGSKLPCPKFALHSLSATCSVLLHPTYLKQLVHLFQ